MESYTIDPDTQWENSLKVLDQFETYRVAYKYINSQPIHSFFVIPKQLPPGPRPLLVRFHGGGWTEGQAEASIRPFFLELALKHGAVILTPDYRLRPEHDLTDGIDDIRSFWKWVENDVQQMLGKSFPGLGLDNSNLLVGGESAGGYLTAQTALLGLTTLPIKILFMQYPALSLVEHFSIPKSMGQADVEQATIFDTVYPYSIIEEHLASLKPGQICARAKFGSRMHLLRAMAQANKFCDFSGDRAWIDPLSSLETAGKLPPILLYQSKEDEAVPWRQTERWATKLQQLQPEVPLFLTWQTGNHVFDTNHNMATPWLKEPLKFVQKYWPAPQIIASGS